MYHPLYIFQHVLSGLDPLSANDGLVTVQSAHYGEFQVIGGWWLLDFVCHHVDWKQAVVELNHLEEIGWFLPGVADDKAHIKLLYKPILELLEKNWM